MIRRVNARTVMHVAAMAALVGGITLAAGFGRPPGHAHFTLDGGLLVSNRSEFRACVEVAEPLRARREAVLAEVAAQLDRVRAHRDWTAAGLGADRPTVTAGCPDQGLPERFGREPTAASAAPSPYRVWIYVLDGGSADRVLGPGVDAGRGAAEHMDVGQRRLAEVSTAVLVRDGYLADPRFAGRELATAVGLATEDGDSGDGTGGAK